MKLVVNLCLRIILPIAIQSFIFTNISLQILSKTLKIHQLFVVKNEKSVLMSEKLCMNVKIVLMPEFLV